MTALITKRRRPSAAAMLGTTIVLLAVALMALSFAARRPGYPLQPLMIAIPSAAVGVLVARSQPRNANGWLLLGIAAAILLSTGAGAYSLLVYRLGEHLPLSPLGLASTTFAGRLSANPTPVSTRAAFGFWTVKDRVDV